jgi:hypothetical protein
MRRKTIDELVVRLALESKKYLDNKELPKDERNATYLLLKELAKYTTSVNYKHELVRLIVEQYEDDYGRKVQRT